MTGAQILIECLKREGVEVMFGYPGGAVLPIFDKLYDADLKFILTRHEQGAAHAADGPAGDGTGAHAVGDAASACA